MAVSLREYRARIKSTESMKKITRAMELIAASRIIKAQQRARAAAPYARELTRAISALATYSNVDHPMTTEPENPKRAAVLIVTSDRGLAGAYSSNVLKEGERLAERLRSEGKEVVSYIAGRKGEAYYKFRQRPIAQSWSGFSERPEYAHAAEAAHELVAAFLAGTEYADDDAAPLGTGNGEVLNADEIHIVYTEFRSMLTQTAVAHRLAPIEVEYGAEDVGPTPSYEFEPDPEELFGSLLPRYLSARVWTALLEAAASESASRRRAMKAATDNANDLIRDLTLEANRARQAQITQEISEIVGGVDALAAAAGSDD